MFSKSCEYGIRATLYIAQNSLNNQRVGLKGIAMEIGSPEQFTAKILQQLARSGVINSTKGPQGGFDISSDKIKEMSLIDIVSAIDGNSIFEGCGLGLKACDAKHPCPMHNDFEQVRDDLRKMLSSSKLLNMADELDKGLTCLKR